ncbi:MAG: secretin N-terminal domain-containing protein [Planctomycetota bacterium]
MKTPRILHSSLVAVALLASVIAAPLANAQTDDKPAETPQEKVVENQVTDDGNIRFSFQDQDWRDVIPWFADQAGFQLQQVDDWPEGVFSLQDQDEYSVLEALDQLNHALRIKKPDAYTLIRNRRMLILTRVADSYPDELIETVNVADLQNRGKYEIMDVKFELSELDGEVIYDELKQLVSDEFRNQYALFPSSNQLQARGTGEQLRNMRDLIMDAMRIMESNQRGSFIYTLKYQDPETFLAIVGAELGFRGENTTNEEGTISIIAEPLSDRLFVSGTKKMRDRFETLATMVDSDPNNTAEVVEVDAPYFFKYPVLSDPKLAFNLLQNVLEGTDAKMEQDEVTGSIVVLARDEDHQRVKSGLAILENNQDGFAIIKLEKIGAAEALTIMQNIFQQNTLDDDSAQKGPQFIADSYTNKIIVSGTVQEVARVRAMLKQLDDEYEDPVPPGPRSRVRIIPMDESEQQKLAPMIESLLGTVNRGNKFRVILPEERKSMNMRIRSGEFDDPRALEEPLPGESLLIPQRATRPDEGTSNQRGNTPSRRNDQGSVQRTVDEWLFVGTQAFGISPVVANTSLIWQEEESTDDDSSKGYQDPDYTPPPKVQSVPGAPITFRFNEYGLTIESEDLDAADDIEYAIRDFLGEESTIQLPVFYELAHRSVIEIKEMLEIYYGMEDGGGGGGGGGGGLMGGMMNNMLGGAGDLLGGLLDTGGGGGGGVLEGDVTFGMDVRFNTLWIRGATDNDLAEINQLIDMWDRPEGSIKPELAGEFRTIDVIHRDAEELVEIIKSQIPDLIRDPEAEKQSGGGNNEARQMMAAIQAMTGKKQGASSADNEEKKPKALLGVDEMTNQLLVTGPSFIYDEILLRVLKLDVPDLTKPKTSMLLPAELGDVESLAKILEEQYKGNIIIDMGDEETGTNRNGSSSTSGRPSSGNTAASTQAKATSDAARAAFMNAIRSNAARGGGGGAQGGGGRGGAGGGRGGRGGGR